MTDYITNKDELHKFFNEEYYKSVNYTDYLERHTKYRKLAASIYCEFNKYNMLTPDVYSDYLDYGCATGMLLHHLQKMLPSSYRCYGFDISDWAIENNIADDVSVSQTLDYITTRSYAVTTALDVFEHMFDDEVTEVLKELVTELLIVRIPVKSHPQATDFHLEVSRRDKSHVNCKTKGQWIDFIENFGYTFKNTLDYEGVIYDAPGCFCGVFEKNI